MRLDNSLIISIFTYSSASWTHTKAQKKRLDAFNTKSPPLHCGRPLVRLRQERLDSYLHRTTPYNDNNPQTSCLRTHVPSTTWHPTIDILVSTPPSTWRRWADQITKDTQLSLSDAVIVTHDIPSWRSLVRNATGLATQVPQVSKHWLMSWLTTGSIC